MENDVCFSFFFNVYLLLRDREIQSVSRGGVERGGDIEFEVDPRLRAVSTQVNVGFEPKSHEIMT